MSNKLNSIDKEIYSCLNLSSPKSFFLFAGAGTGKTRSLVTVLQKFKNENISKLRYNGQKVAIVTFTNAACDEINRRLDYDSAFVVSTIHSFCWKLIKPYQRDIKDWIRSNTKLEINDLQAKERKGRPGTKAARDRKRKIASKTRRLENLARIKSFSYNPNGTNSSRGSLNHSEILKITSDFLSNESLLQRIVVRRFPILLIDESQDTKKELIEAFFKVQANYESEFSLGLFGDTMQRIYMDGKPDLGSSLPESWAKPEKKINYRCPKRVIKLINRIRGEQPQIPAKRNIEGTVRLFIVDSNSKINKRELESKIAKQMAEMASDELWEAKDEVKVLTLEHHMAANRSGFINFFEPLYKMNSDSTSLLDGTMQGIPFIINQLIPLARTVTSNNEFSIAKLMKKYSPLLDSNRLEKNDNPVNEIQNAKKALDEFASLWSINSDPKLIRIIKKVYELSLLNIPEVFEPIVQRTSEDLESDESNEENGLEDNVINAWDLALKSSFSEALKYADYISDNSRFGTHQGIKGLEFPRVMVILDDEEARGFLFSYEKLLGAKEPTATDKRNAKIGKETSIDRTRRLFYVICSRAEESLAVVAYTNKGDKVKEYATSQGWFSEEELVEIN